MKLYDYILLDWDGNIAKTLDLWIAAQDMALRRRGINFSQEQLVESCRGFVAYVAQNSNLTKEDAETALKEVIAIVNNSVQSVELYPGALKTLRHLKAAGKNLAVISTSRRHLIEPVIKRYNMSSLFEVVLCDEDVPFEKRKPHPESLFLALAKMQGTTEAALMMGDRDKDILAAKQAKMDSVLYCPIDNHKFYSPKQLAKCSPAYIIEDFEQLAGIVL